MAESVEHCDDPCVPYKAGNFLLIQEVLAYQK